MGVTFILTISRLVKKASGYPFIQRLTLWTKMDLSLPDDVARGMTKLDRSKFVKDITVPSVEILNKNVGKSMQIFKKFLLKVDKLKPIVEVAGTEEKKKKLLPVFSNLLQQIDFQILVCFKCK